MTHKQLCKNFALQTLTERGLQEFFSENSFNEFYTKKQDKNGNVFTIGLTAADCMLIESKSFFSPSYFNK